MIKNVRNYFYVKNPTVNITKRDTICKICNRILKRGEKRVVHLRGYVCLECLIPTILKPLSKVHAILHKLGVDDIENELAIDNI